MAKQRVHNEHFRVVLLGGRKSCPMCKQKLEEGEHIWSWGEYHIARWNTVRYLCKNCWSDVAEHLSRHTDECGCSVVLVIHSNQRPEWLRLEKTCPA